jgi:hypothetical protein
MRSPGRQGEAASTDASEDGVIEVLPLVHDLLSRPTPQAVSLRVDVGTGAACDVITPCRAAAERVRAYLGAWWHIRLSETAAGDRQHGVPSLIAVLDPDLLATADAVVSRFGERCRFYMRRWGRRLVDGQGSVAVTSREEPSLLVHDPAAGKVVIVAEEERILASMTTRLVRELVTARLESCGWRLLHAAAVGRRGSVVLVCGGKGAGKTAAALALATQGYALVSNDRALVGKVGEEWRVVSWPTYCNVGMSLLSDLGWDTVLRERLAADPSVGAGQLPEIVTAVKSGSGPVVLDGREKKWEHTPSQLRKWYGIELEPGGRLGAVLFPRLDPRGGTAPRIDPSLVRPLGEVDLDIAARAELYPDVLGLRAADPLGPPDTAPISEIATAVPSFGVALGYDVHAAGRFLSKHLEGLANAS